MFEISLLCPTKNRPDRLEKVKKELSYIGWDYEVFRAIYLISAATVRAMIAAASRHGIPNSD